MTPVDAAAVYVNEHRVWLDHHPEATLALEDHDKTVEYWLAFLLSEVATLSEELRQLQRRLDAASRTGPR